MTRLSLMACIVSFLGLFATAQPLRAQSKDVQKVKALAHEQQAKRLYSEGRFAEAAAAFREAYSASADPRYVFNMGKCFERSQNFLEAARHYGRYLRLVPTAKDAKTIRNLMQQLLLRAQPEWARLRVNSVPEGARVYLNDRKQGVQGVTPMRRSLPPGSYTVILERRGYHPTTRTVSLAPRQRSRLNFALKPLTGFLQLRVATAGVKLIIDGVDIGQLSKDESKNRLKLHTGPHFVFLKRKHYASLFRRIVIETGKTTSLSVALTQLPVKIAHTTLWTWGWVTTGVGIAALGAGLTMALLAKGDQERVNSYDRTGEKASLDQVQALRRSAQRKGLSANILFGVGGASLVAATVLFILDYQAMKRSRDRLFSDRFRLEPQFGPSRVGVRWSMSFD